jgi:hypothetical protein
MTGEEAKLAQAFAVLTIIAFVVALVGGTMFSGRKQLSWERAQSRSWLVWERSLWIFGYMLLVIGLVLLTELLQMRGERIFSLMGMTGFAFGILLLIVVEGLSIDGQSWSNYLVRLAVILLLYSQASIGVSMLQVDLFAAWLGWLTIGVNLLFFLLVFRAKDPYFPAMYFLMPLVTGIALLMTA